MDISRDFWQNQPDISFADAVRNFKDTYALNPLDAEYLTGQGVISIQLSVFRNRIVSNKGFQDGIDKLVDALVVDPKKHVAMWWLGKAYRAKALQMTNLDDAKVYLDKAAQFCGQALELEPNNKLYKEAFEVASKAPVGIDPSASSSRTGTEIGKGAEKKFSESVDETMGPSHMKVVFFIEALRAFEATYARNPLDAENLTRWGVVLVDLSQSPSSVSNKQLQDSIDKLNEAVVLDPKRHVAMWWLGKAYKAKALQTPDLDEAKFYFDKAAQCYGQALELEPENKFYEEAFEEALKASVGIRKRMLAPDPSASSLSTRAEPPCATKGKVSHLCKIYPKMYL